MKCMKFYVNLNILITQFHNTYIHTYINFISVSRIHSRHKSTNWGHYLTIYTKIYYSYIC